MTYKYFIFTCVLAFIWLVQWNVYWESSFDCSSSEDVSTQECEVLVDIYDSLQWEQWNASQWWLVDTTISNRVWITVAIKDWNNHIVWIDLSWLWLIGQLPSSIDSLEHLETLILSDNAIVGLPETIWFLDDLLVLDISNTSLSSLPQNIGLLGALSILDIWWTAIQTLPDMSWLISLDQLICTHSDLQTLESDVMQLPDLDSIDCRWSELNQIYWTQSLVQSLLLTNTNLEIVGPLSLPNISVLTIDETPLSSIQITGTMPLLQRLDLWETAMNSIDHLLSKMPEIQYLSIDKSLITHLWNVASLQKLKELRFNNNTVQAFPQWVSELDELRVLYAWSNDMQWTLPSWLASLDELKYVYIDGNAFDRLSDHTIKKNALLTQRSQDMWYKYSDEYQRDLSAPELIIHASPTFFQTWSSIELQIQVDENSYLIDDNDTPLSIVRSWSTTCSMLPTRTITQNGLIDLVYTVWTWVYQDCTLILDDHASNQASVTLWSRVIWDGLEDLCLHPDMPVPYQECRALVTLYQETDWQNWYNSDGRFESPDIDNRHWVDVDWGHVVWIYLHTTVSQDGHGDIQTRDGNNLSWSFPESLAVFTHLEHLNLSNNRLKWPLPESFWGLTFLESILIRNNRITWSLPHSLWSFESLKILDLSDNTLSWELPDSLSNLSELEVLLLRDNVLQWWLSYWVWSLGSLRVLDLTNNTLTWKLPIELWWIWSLTFLRLENNSFVGEIPWGWTTLSLNTLTLNNNALTRTVAHRPVMNAQVTQWRNSIDTRTNTNQNDITSPIITYTQNPINWSQWWTFELTVWVSEESYGIDVNQQWMSVLFSWSWLCEQLTADYVTNTSWDTTIMVIAWEQWRYEWCELFIQDHADNPSNTIKRWDFTTYQGVEAICYNPNLTTSRQTCEDLIKLYTQTNGENRNTNTGWWIDPIVQNWYWIEGNQTNWTITHIWLSNNDLSWDVFINLDVFTDLTLIDLSFNTLNTVEIQIVSDHMIDTIDLSQSTIQNFIISWREYLSSLRVFDISTNGIGSSLPVELFEIQSLQKIDISNNQLSGSFPESIAALLHIEEINISNNAITWKLPIDISSLMQLSSINVSNNLFDRDASYASKIPQLLSWYISWLQFYDWSWQGDSIPPVLLSLTHPQLIQTNLAVTLEVYEWSFATTLSWAWMDVAVTWPWYCTSILPDQSVTWSLWTWIINLWVVYEWEYQWCTLSVTDHGGNVSSKPLNTFNSSLRCGNGQIELWEVCDEWRSCADGTDCTTNPSICPDECEVRFVDSCNQNCKESYCGDWYTDTDGIDNDLWTNDDEQCDGWMYCSDTGEECTNNTSLCPQTCAKVVTESCNTECKLLTCWDWFVDIAWSDGIVWNWDIWEEQCDDENSIDGDGCNSSCQLEHCGDWYRDTDWYNNDYGYADPEWCDEWPNNGIAWWTCSTSCEVVGDTCYGCREWCESWWTWNHVTFLIFDVSWSMNGHNRKENAQDAHHRFIDLLPDSFLDTNWNVVSWSIAWLATFNNGWEILVSPTDIDAFLHDKIDSLDAWWTTNYATVLTMIDNMIDEYDASSEFHVVLLSDGEPTQPGWKKRASNAAKDAASALKSQGVEIYSVWLQQSNKWMDLLEVIASWPQYVYEDPDNNRLTEIYEEIYGSIHCDCFNKQICPECWNKAIELGEQCDLWRRCDDAMTIECTDDPSLCPESCLPRWSQTCSWVCEHTICGDTRVQYPNHSPWILEVCDDGNTINGDGCNELCQVESCGDGYHDPDWPDNKYWDENDEQCDDGLNNGSDARCLNDCKRNPDFIWDSWVCGIEEPLYSIQWDGGSLDLWSSELCISWNPIQFEYSPTLHMRSRTCQWVQWAENEQCELTEWYCGDWTIDTESWEQCDDGNQTNGDGCSAVCQHESIATSSEALWELCHENTTPLVVQSNEIVPLTRSFDLAAWIDISAESCNDIRDGFFIPWWSLQCEVSMPWWWDITVPCLEFTNWSAELFQDVLNDYSRDTESLWGTVLSTQPLWRQMYSIGDISYTHCDTSRTWKIREHQMTQQWMICTMPVWVAEWYRIEKWATLSSTSEWAISLVDELWNQLVTDKTRSAVENIQSTKDFQSLIALFLEEFVGENRWSSVVPAFPWWADQSTKRSLTKRVHFFKWTQTRRAITLNDSFLENPEKPFSLVVEDADLVIDWSLAWNGMYIVDWWSVRFENQNCDMADTVAWIFVTDWWFETSITLNQDPYASKRCKWGNLIINWLFIGSWIDEEFVSRRRSLLDLWWFEYDNEESELLSDDEKKKRIREQWDRIVEWPSVRIDTSPLARSELPPWVRELFEAIAVWR